MDIEKALLISITNNHSLPQSQQLTEATDIQKEEIIISINLPYVEGTSEKLRRILRSHKIRLTTYTDCVNSFVNQRIE